MHVGRQAACPALLVHSTQPNRGGSARCIHTREPPRRPCCRHRVPLVVCSKAQQGKAAAQLSGAAPTCRAASTSRLALPAPCTTSSHAPRRSFTSACMPRIASCSRSDTWQTQAGTGRGAALGDKGAKRPGAPATPAAALHQWGMHAPSARAHSFGQSIGSPTELWEVPIIIGRSENCCMAARSEGPSASLHRLSLDTADMARA